MLDKTRGYDSVLPTSSDAPEAFAPGLQKLLDGPDRSRKMVDDTQALYETLLAQKAQR